MWVRVHGSVLLGFGGKMEGLNGIVRSLGRVFGVGRKKTLCIVEFGDGGQRCGDLQALLKRITLLCADGKPQMTWDIIISRDRPTAQGFELGT